MSLTVQAGLLIVVFAAVTALALALGAASLGIAATFGQIGFALALVTVLLRS
jgi:hypothetical protein